MRTQIICRELELRRVKRAFDEIKKAWWWFDETSSRESDGNAIAWQWELLRRSDIYRAFYAKADAIRVSDPTERSLAGFFGSAMNRAKLHSLAGSYARLGNSDPCHKWPNLFYARCAPDVCWAALPEESRNVIDSACPLYPRAEVAAAFTSPGGDSIEVEPIIVKRPPSGQEELTSLVPGPSTAILGRYNATNLLPAILPANSTFGVYVVVIFDVRNAEFTVSRLEKPSVVLTRLNEIFQNSVTMLNTWLIQNKHTAPTPRRSLALVIPSNIRFKCQVWIPADAMTQPADILPRFRTLISSRTRHQWLPECEKFWGKLFPSFPAVSIASLQAKRARIKDTRDLQAGLCAFDCRRVENRFTQGGLLVPFLKKH